MRMGAWLTAAIVFIAALSGCGGGGGGGREEGPPSAPPGIAVQPQDATIADGASAIFSVTATGSGPLSYQWRKHGAAIPGATGSIYATPLQTLADSLTEYSVVVSNAAGSVTSESVTLTVTPVAPRVTAPPQDMVVVDGSTVTFSVSATGSGTLSYQWLIDGVPAAGETGQTLSFVASPSDNGKHVSVTVSSAYGADASAQATLIVDPRAISFVDAPQDAMIVVGSQAQFSATASGTAPITYQWERSGDGGVSWTPVAGAVGPDFTLPSATLGWADARLRVKATNAAGPVASISALLSVKPNVRIVAGVTGGNGFADGTATQARFHGANGTAIDSAGNIYVADSINAVIRKVTPGGVVTTLAGQPQVHGHADGPASSAMFFGPNALAIDGSGNLYAGDGWRIRKISPSGVVSTLAGDGPGSNDGTGSGASFRDVRGIVSDAAGNLVVIDSSQNQIVRRVSSSGVVTTLAGTAGVLGSADGMGASASFTSLNAIAADGTGDFYVGDAATVRRVRSDGSVSLFAGLPGAFGTQDGPRLSARFIGISGLVFDNLGNLYIGDTNAFRRIASDGDTITLAGYGLSTGGDVDGAGGTAYVAMPSGLTLAPNGSAIVFASPGNGTVRSVTLGGTVTTIAGASPQYASVDGPGSTARVFSPGAIAADLAGNVYIPEGATNSVRRVVAGGQVSTIGLKNVVWSNVRSVAIDASGFVYLADVAAHQVGKMAPDGTVTILAGVAGVTGHQDGAGNQAKFSFPSGIAVDSAGNVFVADTANSTIRKVDSAGTVSTVAGQPGQCGHIDGSSAQSLLCNPKGMAFDRQGRLLIADEWSHTIRRLETDGMLTTVAGVPFLPGLGNGFVAAFKWPSAIAVDTDGNAFVADGGNAKIRRIAPSGFVSTVMGRSGVLALQPGVDGAINTPQGVAVLPGGRVVLTSEQALVGD
jgi:sugar lactone lactonase YvrE